MIFKGVFTNSHLRVSVKSLCLRLCQEQPQGVSQDGSLPLEVQHGMNSKRRSGGHEDQRLAELSEALWEL